MTIHEPMTLATDYALAAVTCFLCIRLLRERPPRPSRGWWGVAFAALALGAFLGGTWHGLLQSALLWKATVLSVGVASFAMVVGSAFATTRGAVRETVLALATVVLLAYSGWMLFHNEFIYVVIDTGIAFAAVALLHLWRFNGWILAGVAVSVVAGLVQASGFKLHEHFNHNDLYHVIQIGAMFLLYRGVRGLTDAGAPTPAPPAA